MASLGAKLVGLVAGLVFGRQLEIFGSAATNDSLRSMMAGPPERVRVTTTMCGSERHRIDRDAADKVVKPATVLSAQSDHLGSEITESSRRFAQHDRESRIILSFAGPVSNASGLPDLASCPFPRHQPPTRDCSDVALAFVAGVVGPRGDDRDCVDLRRG